jgi:protein involved in polysaccharide export with SLBB domain
MKTSVKLIVIYILFVQVCSYSQNTNSLSSEKSTTTQSQMFQLNKTGSVNTDAGQLLNSINSTGTYTSSMPVEGVVDAKKYVVGQGDLFSLGLYGYINQVIPLSVSIEGTIIIPSIGEVDVNGCTLEKAKEKVINTVKKRYYSSDASFTLVQPRTFLIPVDGLFQGTYVVTSLTRPSQLLSTVLLDSLNVQKRIYDKSKFEDIETQYSFRNIELKRKDGSVARVDIYKYFTTKEDKYNPTFKEGDLLKIPSMDINKNRISVYGAVQIQGNYEYAPDDDLETVIGLGRGFDANAEKDSIVLYRPYGESKGFETYNLSYEKDKNFKIEVFDRVFVKFKTDTKKMITAQVMGEVSRPGIYPINFKNTRLKDIIEMAGGFKENAYLPLCIIFRKYDKEYAQKDTIEVLVNRRANDLIVTDKDKLNFEDDIRARRNRVVVDFEKLFLKNDESQNIIIEDKDVIYINDDKKTVYVYGQVQNEGYVPYKKDATVDYYIEKAGGYSLAADEDDTRIIKFNTRGWYKPKDMEINSGDFVYVPKVSKKSFTETITLISQISGVILGVLTTYIVLRDN